MTEDWRGSYVDGLVCRWATKRLGLNSDEIVKVRMGYDAAIPDWSDVTPGDPSYWYVNVVLVGGAIKTIELDLPLVLEELIEEARHQHH